MVRIFTILTAVTCILEIAQAQENTGSYRSGVLDLPLINTVTEHIHLLISQGDFSAADIALNKAINKMPLKPELFILQSRLDLLNKTPTKALASLERAVDLGFADLEVLLQDPAFVEMQIAQGIGSLIKRSSALPRLPPPISATRKDGEILVGPDNLIWDATTKRFIALVDLKDVAPDTTLTSPEASGADITYLQKLATEGKACGLGGILYDNRDRNHSLFSYNEFPQLTRVQYDNQMKPQRLDYGAANDLIFTTIAFGNSSTRYKGFKGRSLAHRSMTWPGEAKHAYQNYISDHIYVYPDGRDNFPANWPYTLTSKGASGSDRWLLRLLALIIAAIPCDTRNSLDDKNLVSPTVQMILRREQLHILSRDAYLSGAAHPAIFDKDIAAPKRMMDLAASMRPDEIPPMVKLRIIEEGFQDSAGLAGLSEKLYDTPSAIARLWRGWSGRQTIELTAEDTTDPNGRDLTFSWRVLRGDMKHVRIKPDGAKATISIDWHNLYSSVKDRKSANKRIDIGVFAHNGVHDSTPAFFSVDFPTHQIRKYARGPKGRPQLISIDYDAIKRRKRFDPVLYWSAPWTDQFGYDNNGNLVGWMRKSKTSKVRFLANGTRSNGQKQAYIIKQIADNPPVLIEQ